MRRFGQWDTSGACYPNVIPIITSRRNTLVTAYNAAREKIIESRDDNLAVEFNKLKNEVDQFHYQQVQAFPCPWADPSPWGHMHITYANRFNALRQRANNQLIAQKKQQIKDTGKVQDPKQTPPTQDSTKTTTPKAKAPPKPKPPPPCKPRPCGTPPYNMKCKVPGKGPTNPICKCGKWVCPGGPSWEQVEAMKKKGKGGISPYMSQAYGIKRYAPVKAKPKPKAEPKAKAEPKKAAGLGEFVNKRNLLLGVLAAGAIYYCCFR